MKPLTYRIVGIMAVLLAVTSLSVTAFGIVMPYWEGHPLVMEPGESKLVTLTLQNIGDEDISVEVKLTEGESIARITDPSNVYVIPKGNTDTGINMMITIPSDGAIGSKYKVGVSIKDIGAKDKGMVQLTNSINKELPIEVNLKPKPVEEVPPSAKKLPILPIISAAIILLILILIIYKYSKKRTKQKQAQNKSKV